MPRVVILGRQAAILPFKAVGVELMPADHLDQSRQMLRKLAHEMDEGLIFLPEDVAQGSRDEIAALRRHPKVAVLALAQSQAPSGEPGEGTSAVGAQREWVRQLVRRSIGVDLMGRK